MKLRAKRAILATAIGLVLIVAIFLILGFVDATAMVEESKRCTPSFWQGHWPKYIWQAPWPKYAGCTMATHEALAAGLIGAAGAIWAAWLAYSAVQDQIAAERRARERQHRQDREAVRRRQRAAKELTKVSIMPAIRAAAVAMFIVDRATGNPFGARESIENALTHLRVMLDSFGLRESIRDLATDDRLRYLEIIGLLTNLVSVGEHGHSDFERRLDVLLSGFRRFYELLQQCDSDLADEFAGVSEVVPRRK